MLGERGGYKRSELLDQRLILSKKRGWDRMTEQGRCGGVHGDSGTQVLPICELTNGSKDRESPFKMIKCYTLWRGLVDCHVRE